MPRSRYQIDIKKSEHHYYDLDTEDAYVAINKNTYLVCVSRDGGIKYFYILVATPKGVVIITPDFYDSNDQNEASDKELLKAIYLGWKKRVRISNFSSGSWDHVLHFQAAWRAWLSETAPKAASRLQKMPALLALTRVTQGNIDNFAVLGSDVLGDNSNLE
jgi:hypothetical protein